jgi:hypothetical protein
MVELTPDRAAVIMHGSGGVVIGVAWEGVPPDLAPAPSGWAAPWWGHRRSLASGRRHLTRSRPPRRFDQAVARNPAAMMLNPRSHVWPPPVQKKNPWAARFALRPA